MMQCLCRNRLTFPGTDDVGEYTLDGTLTTVGMLHLVKRYRRGTGDSYENKGHEVHYQGHKDAVGGLTGTWRISTLSYSGSGNFALHPVLVAQPACAPGPDFENKSDFTQSAPPAYSLPQPSSCDQPYPLPQQTFPGYPLPYAMYPPPGPAAQSGPYPYPAAAPYNPQPSEAGPYPQLGPTYPQPGPLYPQGAPFPQAQPYPQFGALAAGPYQHGPAYPQPGAAYPQSGMIPVDPPPSNLPLNTASTYDAAHDLAAQPEARALAPESWPAMSNPGSGSAQLPAQRPSPCPSNLPAPSTAEPAGPSSQPRAETVSAAVPASVESEV